MPPSNMKEYMLARYHRRRQEWIDSQGAKCANCGATEELEIDHINREDKSYNIGQILTSGNENMLRAELAKCQVLCHTCHKDKSAQEAAVEHGGGKAGKKNCKCDPCRLKKNEYLREWKRKNRAK